MHYERVRFKGQTAKLRITGETEHFLQGIAVDKFGDEVSSRDYDEQVHLIDKSCITKRTPLRMNNFYAELEEG